MATWITPKTDWSNSPTERFNFSDYNRIRNNIQALKERAVEFFPDFSIESMGTDITTYDSYWPVSVFNAVERNLDTISQNTYGKNYGTRQTFYANGLFIRWDELNRIESATLDIYQTMDNQEAGLHRIPFKLGRFKEVRV